jgi:hypothetical protein
MDERDFEVAALSLDAALAEIDAGDDFIVTDLVTVYTELTAWTRNAAMLIRDELDGPTRVTLKRTGLFVERTGRFVRTLPTLVAHTLG